MKTTSKTTGLLLAVVLLFCACIQYDPTPVAEFATFPVYEFSNRQPEQVAGQSLARTASTGQRNRSITDILTDCESQLDRIRKSFSASVGQPHK